ncbi:MAG TPA: hypothetical protein PK733_12635 [Clostridiales bacterium]|nr:hypothetical protein [Clostridiales bacterium]
MMEALKFSISVLFRPLDAFNYIKINRGDIQYWAPACLVFLMLPIRVLSIFLEHYPVAVLLPNETNLILEAVKVLVPVLTWTISCFAVTSIAGGETTQKEIFIASAYSIVPYLIITIPQSIFSKLLGRSELGLYNTLETIKWVWVVLLFIINVKVMNDYSIKKAIAICALGIVGVVLIWGVLLLAYVLTNQLYSFLASVILEIRMLYGG